MEDKEFEKAVEAAIEILTASAIADKKNRSYILIAADKKIISKDQHSVNVKLNVVGDRILNMEAFNTALDDLGFIKIVTSAIGLHKFLQNDKE